ncbi:tetratricopeptide repeat protein [Algoriphagus sp.]|uniref:tetratricopeptide repeat protein n=1 Tax=Algoriphagus sp. TaxID=1872435 RepID=UPI00261D8A21|nr:tetratricopeptide repeat protein [Algoriphagus sp.]
MKIKSTLLGLSALLLAGMVQAQDGWNWPADQAQEAKAREYNAAYTDYMKADQFIEATKPLHWLLVNVPELNESIYQNGVTVYKGAADATTDEAQKRIYQDSVLAIYDKREEIYNNAERWIENKAYYNYGFFKGTKEKLAGVVADFERALEINGGLSLTDLYAAYFDAVYRHNAYNKVYEPEEVLAIYDKIQKYLETAEAEGKDVSSAKSTTETILVAMELIDCDFIENTLGPKLMADPTNEALAQQIFKYSVQYKCYSSEAFLSALELIDSNNPTFSTSQVRAMRYMQNKEYEKAQPVLEKALDLAENNTQKGEIYMELAKVHANLGRKSDARNAAKQAASIDESLTQDAYSMIGGLYMNSFNDCRGGQSRVKDRAIYMAAYNAYQRAGDSKGMASARAQFPSREEVFTEGLEVGATVSTGCWIGESVSIATRD